MTKPLNATIALPHNYSVKKSREFIQKIDNSPKNSLCKKDWQKYSKEAYRAYMYYYKNKDKSMNLSLSDYFYFKALRLPHDHPFEKDRAFIKKIEGSQREDLVDKDWLEYSKKAYEIGLFFYKNKYINLALAEEYFIKALRPALSKPSMSKIVFNKEDTQDLEYILLDSMYHLGEIYLRNGTFNNYAKAAAIFQYCSKFKKKYAVNFSKRYILSKAYKVEKEFLVSLGIKPNNIKLEESTHNIKLYKNLLKDFRTDIEKELKDTIKLIEDIGKRASKVEAIYKKSSNFFVHEDGKRGLIQKLLADCYQQLGDPPNKCKYSILALGSLAGGKMTPYSDLEFAILIEDINHETNKENKEYFRNLTKLLNIKVVNFGETPLVMLGIEAFNNFKTAEDKDNWLWDDVLQSGFSFDGNVWHACKLPLGRQGLYKANIIEKDENGVEHTIKITKLDYELILTPVEMLEFQTKPSWYESDKFLVQGLRSISLIDGSQDLLNDYRDGLKALDKNITQKRCLEILSSDIDKFQLKLGDEEEGKLFNVKKSIYRISDMVIDALADYYDIYPENGEIGLTVWQKIEKMHKNGYINQKGEKHLKEAISIATELRLSTYLHNKGQFETLSTYEPAKGHLSDEERERLIIRTFYTKNTDNLRHFYHIMIRVQQRAKDLCNKERQNLAKSQFTKDNLIDETDYTKGMVHARFLEYNSAFVAFEIAYKEKKNKKDLEFISHYFFLCRKIDNRAIPIELLKNIVKNQEDIEDIEDIYNSQENQINLAMWHNNLGGTLVSNDEYDQALIQFKISLKRREKIYPKNHIEIVDSYTNISHTYHLKGDYKKAFFGYDKASMILKNIFGKKANIHLANLYSHVAMNHTANADYDKAIDLNHKSLIIKESVYKDNPNHFHISNNYTSLASAYASKGKYEKNISYFEKAIEYYEQALDIDIHVYKNVLKHSSIAVDYNNLSVAHLDKIKCENKLNQKIIPKLYKKIKTYLNHAMDILKYVYSENLNNLKIAAIHNTFGMLYSSNHDFVEAISSYEETLKIYEVNSINNFNISFVYQNLGNAHNSRHDYIKGLFYLKESLRIIKGIYPNHPIVTMMNNNLKTAERQSKSLLNKRDYNMFEDYN